MYVWRNVQRGIRDNGRFFSSLVERVSQVLQPKGFTLTKHVYLPKSFGHRIATFESATLFVDVLFDGKERDIRLTRRAPEQSNLSAGEVLAEAYLGFHPTTAEYTRATALILDGAASI